MSHAVILQSCCSLWPNVSNIKLYNIYRPDCLKERHIQETRKACGKYVLSCGNIFPTNALSSFVIQIRKHSNIKLIYFYVNILHRLIGMFIMLFSIMIWNSIFEIAINMLIDSCALHVPRQKKSNSWVQMMMLSLIWKEKAANGGRKRLQSLCFMCGYSIFWLT